MVFNAPVNKSPHDDANALHIQLASTLTFRMGSLNSVPTASCNRKQPPPYHILPSC